ncbi:MAG: hypothetical protein FWC16_02240 [Defluviitaleaceae bacterium]|nr:hypothetical protein [Defluviitaleaceae bacterium]MCL2273719.1 hypothetical protein [Defluviitaleaceae bacterium]
MENTNLKNTVEKLASINIEDCTGCCNEIKAAAENWLKCQSDGGCVRNKAADRLHVAAKSALARDSACGHHTRDDLLTCVMESQLAAE